MQSNTTSRWAVSAETCVSAHVNGLAVLHIPSGCVFVCNRTGARVWQGISKGLSSEEVSQEISREYGLAPELARRDTGSFVNELERRGLIQRTAG